MSRQDRKPHPPNGTLPGGLFPLMSEDDDLQETADWLDALENVIAVGGSKRAAYLLTRLKHRAFNRGVRYAGVATTPYVVLGADGFGRSEARKELRRFFEVDAENIALAALAKLAEEGEYPQEKLPAAVKTLGLDPNKPNSVTA